MKKHQPDPHWQQTNLWEYRLQAQPDEALHEKLIAEKKYFEGKYETEIAAKTLPHITIAHFRSKDILEDRIGRLLQNICNQHYSFTVALNNFSGFPSTAVYIRVQDTPFQQLAHALHVLDDMLQTNGCPPLQTVPKPHLNIASQLQEDMYHAAIKEYAARDFHERFMVEKLVLLKRESPYKNWQHVNYFYLPPERNLFN